MTISIDSFIITAEKSTRTKNGMFLSGQNVSIKLPVPSKRYLYSGWQSWSLTAWIDTDLPIAPSRPSSLRPMQTDPAFVSDRNPNGSWYGAVELEDGQVFFIGALDIDSHVRLKNQTLSGRYENNAGEWYIDLGKENEIFSNYADLLKDRFGKGRIDKPLRIWCSWYSLYTQIYEDQLLKILNDLGNLPFDVFQVDDGWQKSVGEWEPNAKFPSGMQSLASRIKSTGRAAGLWLAPLLAVSSSAIFREHQDWLLHDEKGKLVSAGFNWGENLYAIDTTHPAALKWLEALMKKVREWGYDYAKLDFLYAGALPGKRHSDIPREAAYRNGLKVIREALGDAYLLTCGAPVIPSLGLCDGMRVGPDVAGHWSSYRDDVLLQNPSIPGVRNAIRTTLNRLWLKPLLQTDPDVVFFRSRLLDLSSSQKSLLQDLARIADFKATSDIPAWMTQAERSNLREFLEEKTDIKRKSQYEYLLDGQLVDFKPYIGMTKAPDWATNILGTIIGGLANVSPLMKVFEWAGQRELKRNIKNNPV